MSNFFDESASGKAIHFIANPAKARIRDGLCDLLLFFKRRLFALSRTQTPLPRRRVLIAGIKVPGREADIGEVTSRLARSRHEVTVSLVTMGDKGKFANIDDAIAAAPQPLETYDWLIIADDDIAFGSGLLDDLIQFSERAGLTISQPAHRFNSYASFAVTQRHWGSLVRESRFVEIGPLTAIHKAAFSAVIPFPPSRWCWGIDVYWSQLVRDRNWKMGIVDAAPVGHLRPVGKSYNAAEAEREARGLLERFGVTLTRPDVLLYDQPIL